MSNYSSLLIATAQEARAYEASAVVTGIKPEWLRSFSNRAAAAGQLTNAQLQEEEIQALAHMLIDSGPLNVDFCPSFSKALEAFQRSRKANR